MKNRNFQKVFARLFTVMYLFCFVFQLFSKCFNAIFGLLFFIFGFSHNEGTDATLLMKLNANHGNKSIFVKPFSDHAVSFGIRHFAGVVMYYSKGKGKQIFQRKMN